MNWINRIETLISKSLSKIGLDGMAHIIVCQNLVMWLSKFTPLWLAIIITVVIFILKEIYDKYCKKTEFSIKDIICDCVGLALGVLTLIL
nr:MAG TPA: putative periplasmic lipoprotein [Bacteriophage sp.]